jgi:hypothetical protein
MGTARELVALSGVCPASLLVSPPTLRNPYIILTSMQLQRLKVLRQFFRHIVSIP